jgi:uncharacterized DUF497 family protein
VHTADLNGYEWNPEKAAANFKKHGVRFADAALSLEDPMGISIPDPHAWHEPRFIFLGVDPSGRLLLTVYTFRERSIRIISARVASPAERREYEGNP